MPDVAVRESRERIKSAMINSDFAIPVTAEMIPRPVFMVGSG